MSPAILLGQQAGSSETIPGVGAWEGEQFPWDRHGVLKEVGPILTQPLPGRGTHTCCVNPPALRRGRKSPLWGGCRFRCHPKYPTTGSEQGSPWALCSLTV